MDPTPTYRLGVQKDQWILCKATILTMWQHRERMGSFPAARGNWKLAETAMLTNPTYWIPYNLLAWREAQGYIPVHVEFSHEMQVARGVIISVTDAIGEPRSEHRIFPVGVQPGIVDMMSINHPDQRSILTQADIFAVVRLLNDHVAVKE